MAFMTEKCQFIFNGRNFEVIRRKHTSLRTVYVSRCTCWDMQTRVFFDSTNLTYSAIFSILFRKAYLTRAYTRMLTSDISKVSQNLAKPVINTAVLR